MLEARTRDRERARSQSGSVATYSASFLKTDAYFLIDQAAAFFACFGEAKRITRTDSSRMGEPESG